MSRKNTLGVMLGDGWFNHKVVWNPPSKSCGQPVLNAFRRIRHADGREQVVATEVHIPGVFPDQQVTLPAGLAAADGIIRPAGSGCHTVLIRPDR